MKTSNVLFYFILLLLTQNLVAQNESLNKVEYTVIAKGTDSPIPELQIVCYNKFFNKDYLSSDFRIKYNLDNKNLYKKKMLIEVFHSDKDKKGIDNINLIGIWEDDKTITVKYNTENSNTENDNESLSPFLIVQIPKSKKGFKFIVNGNALGNATKTYVD